MAKEFFIGDFLKRIKRPLTLSDNQDYNLVTIKMNHNGVVLRGKKKGRDIKSNMYEVKEGDFILSGIDARNGAFGIIPKELDGAIVTNDFWYFEIDEKFISKKLFLELTATNWFDDICKKGSDGTTQRIRLQKNKFFNQKILLPEGVEQEELLIKILDFKEGQSKLDIEIETQQNLLSQLKHSILQEAIQGKLTADWREENPNTEPASELLNRIKSVKALSIKEKKIKKEKALLSITDEEIPFNLPKGWAWCRLADLTTINGGFAFKSSKYINEGVRVIRISDFNEDGFSNNKIVRYKYTYELEPYILKEENILMAMTGGTVGKSLLVKDLPEKMVVNQRVATINILSPICPSYINCVIPTNLVQNIIKKAKNSTNDNISMGNIKAFLIPIPPLEEQKVIVKKVETLMQKCQALEEEIKSSEANAQMLMQAVLKEAFEGKKEEVVI